MITGIKIDYNTLVILFYTTMLLFTWHCNNAWKYIDRKYKKISLLLESLLGIQSTSEEWGCLRKQEWEHRRQNMNQSSSWPEQQRTAFCCIYRSVVFDNDVDEWRAGQDEKLISEPPIVQRLLLEQKSQRGWSCFCYL